MKYLLNSSP